jgi:hypothetical protein
MKISKEVMDTRILNFNDSLGGLNGSSSHDDDRYFKSLNEVLLNPDLLGKDQAIEISMK